MNCFIFKFVFMSFSSVSDSIVRHFGISGSSFSHGRYCKQKWFVVKIVFKEFENGFLMFSQRLGNRFLTF